MNEPIEHYRRQLWGQVTRGLFGIIRIMQDYHKSDLSEAPTNDLRLAAKHLNQLADQIESQGQADNTFTYSAPSGKPILGSLPGQPD